MNRRSGPPVTLDLVKIPAGSFWMGSSQTEVDAAVDYWSSRLVDPSFDAEQLRRWLSKEMPRHRRVLGAYLIGRVPVTNEQYRVFVDGEGVDVPESLALGESDRCPVWGVSWQDASAFCAWLGRDLGRACRLPSGAEWERAARGPSGREYPFGDEFDPALCNTIEGGFRATTPVDAYPLGASEWGVLDLGGNVEEWTSDLYAPYLGGCFVYDDITTAVGLSYHVLRGGSFARGGDLARCARRHGPYSGSEYRYRGFRACVPTGGGDIDDRGGTFTMAKGHSAAVPLLGSRRDR